MSLSYDGGLLDHLAEHMMFLSTTPSFRYSLSSSYDHGFHLSHRLGMTPHDYEYLPLQQTSLLITQKGASPYWLVGIKCASRASAAWPIGCCIASCHPLVAPPFCPLFTLASCCIASPSHLVAPYFLPLIAPAGCCIPT
jgi:hypothetical protein